MQLKANVIPPGKLLTCCSPPLSPPALLWIYKYSRSVINSGALLRLCQLRLELTVQLLIMTQQQPDTFKSF